MSKKIFTFLILLSLGLSVHAQTLIKGRVYSLEKKAVPLYNVSIKNLQTRVTVNSNARGDFALPAKVGDLIELSGESLKTDTVLLINLLARSFYLAEKSFDINGVEISGIKLSPEFNSIDPEAKEYKRFDSDGLRGKGNTDRAGGIIFSLGYGKYQREQQKKDELYQRDLTDMEINKNFTERNVQDLTKLTGQELKNFMSFYRPSVALVQSQRPFNYPYYIATAFNSWKKLPPENRKVPQLIKPKMEFGNKNPF